MGNILNIRVIAQTLNEEDVSKAWPGLCALVWPEWAMRLKLWTLPLKKLLGTEAAQSYLASPSPVEKALGKRKHGVSELAEGLGDLLRLDLGLLSEAAFSILQEPGAKVAEALKGLNNALEDWNPKEANAMSNDLEKSLDLAEDALNKLPTNARP